MCIRDVHGVMDSHGTSGYAEFTRRLAWSSLPTACLQMGQSGSGGDQVSRSKEDVGARAYEFPELRRERCPTTHRDQIVRGAARHVIGMEQHRTSW